MAEKLLLKLFRLSPLNFPLLTRPRTTHTFSATPNYQLSIINYLLSIIHYQLDLQSHLEFLLELLRENHNQ